MDGKNIVKRHTVTQAQAQTYDHGCKAVTPPLRHQLPIKMLHGCVVFMTNNAFRHRKISCDLEKTTFVIFG